MTRLSEVGTATPVDLPCDCPHDDELCDDQSPTRWICTRETGHGGLHVACGVRKHRIRVWADGGNERNPETIDERELQEGDA